MNGAIFYTSKYGSTAQYARWIAEATGLPLFDIDSDRPKPADHDFAVLLGPIVYHKIMGHKWAKRHQSGLMRRPLVLVSVSGAGPGPKLDCWIAGSLPPDLVSHAQHFALRRRQNPSDLTLYDWVMLKIGGLMNPDPKARRE